MTCRKTQLMEHNAYASSIEKAHGRIDKRECWLLPDLTWLESRNRWAGLSGAALIRSTRTTSDGKTSTTDRYYLYSHARISAEQLLHLQRSHWAIENNLHWTLDVTFGEDNAHVRLGHAAVVLNILRKMVLLLLKSDSSSRGSISSKRLRCSWDFSFALRVISNASS